MLTRKKFYNTFFELVNNSGFRNTFQCVPKYFDQTTKFYTCQIIVTSCYFQGGLQAVAKNYTLVKLVAKKIQTSQTSCQEDTD